MVGREKHVLVLLSGGMDSAACVKYYLNMGFEVEGMFIDYGQAALAAEMKSASSIASHYDIHLDTVVCQLGHQYKEGEILGRNALFVLAALMHRSDHGLIALGIHGGTPYYDCGDSFVVDINRVLAGYCSGSVAVDAPFLKWDKRAIYEFCRDHGVPLQLTHSCEVSDEPCGKCRSCLDRRALDAC